MIASGLSTRTACCALYRVNCGMVVDYFKFLDGSRGSPKKLWLANQPSGASTPLDQPFFDGSSWCGGKWLL